MNTIFDLWRMFLPSPTSSVENEEQQPQSRSVRKNSLSDEDLEVLRADFGLEGFSGGAVEAFDAVASALRLDIGERLNPKRKRFLLRRFLRIRQRQQPADFVALAIGAMKGAQGKRALVLDRERRVHLKQELKKTPVSSTAATAEGIAVLAGLPARTFYKTPEWRRVRVEALRFYGSRCMRCGAAPVHGARLFVMHRVSRFLKPERVFDLKNLWVLCGSCRDGELARSRLARQEAANQDPSF